MIITRHSQVAERLLLLFLLSCFDFIGKQQRCPRGVSRPRQQRRLAFVEKSKYLMFFFRSGRDWEFHRKGGCNLHPRGVLFLAAKDV